MQRTTRFSTPCYLALPALVLAAIVLQPAPAHAQMTSVGIDCAQIQSLQLLKQDNMRAGQALIECGIVRGGRAAEAGSVPPAPPNVQVSNRSCTDQFNCTHSESNAWGSTKDNGTTIVVNYNDHVANQYSGTSYSSDGGVTFHEIMPPPFGTAHGTNFGDPIVVFNSKLNKWVAGDLVSNSAPGKSRRSRRHHAGAENIAAFRRWTGEHQRRAASRGARDGQSDGAGLVWIEPGRFADGAGQRQY